MARRKSTPFSSQDENLLPAAPVRVNVLPLHDSDRAVSRLGDVVAVEVDPATTAFQFKRQLSLHFKTSRNAIVPSLYVMKWPYTNAPSVQSVRGLVMRRENYLRMGDSVVAACARATTPTEASTSSDRVHIVALVIAPRTHISEFLGLRSLGSVDTEAIEGLLFSEADARVLPRPPMTLGPIFVRDAYVRMFELVSERIGLRLQSSSEATQQRPKRHKPCDAVIVTGTSGVGKTAFMWYVVRNVSKTRTVVVDLPETCLLIRPDGTVLEGSRDYEFYPELRHKETVYAADELPIESTDMWSWVQAKKIVVSPPHRRTLIDYEARLQTPMILFVPLWSRDEVVECLGLCYTEDSDRDINTMTEDKIATLYDPSISGVRSLELKAQHLTREEVQVVVSAEGKDFRRCKLPAKDVYLELLYLKPSSDFLSATLEFASSAVRQEVIARKEEIAKQS